MNRLVRYRSALSGMAWQGLYEVYRCDSGRLRAEVVWELFERGMIDSDLMITDLGVKVVKAK